jgi:O-antigen/teichoic acid export membrane protein
MFLSLSLAGGLALLISIFIARRLGAADFGMYSVLISIQGVALLLASFNVGTAIAKYVAEYRVRDEDQALRFAKSGFVVVLLLTSLVGVVYVALSGVIGRGLYNDSAMVLMVPFSALMVVSSSTFSVSVGIVQGCQKFRLMAGAQIASPLFSLILILLLLPLMGIRGIFIGYFLSQLTVAAVMLVALNRREFRFFPARLELRRESATVSMLLSYALPAGLSTLMVTPVVWIANTELTLNAGFEAMGYFAVAYVVYQALILIPTSISYPLMPRVSQLTVGNHNGIERLVGKLLRSLSIALFPVLFAIALFSEFIVEILYGSKFSASAKVVYLMVTASYFYSLSAVIGSMIAGMGRMWLGLGLNILWAAVFLTLVFVGIPTLGMDGLALSYAAAYGIFLVFTIVVSKRVLRIGLKGIYLAGASSAFFFLTGFLTEGMSTASGLAVKLGLLLVGTAYFCLIGRDVVRSIYLRVVGVLHRSGFLRVV